MFCEVVIPRTPLNCLTYCFRPEETGELEPGDCVRVPLRGRQTLGVVWAINREGPAALDCSAIQSVAGLIGKRVVSLEMLNLVRWVADYYASALGEVMGFVLPRMVSRALLVRGEEEKVLVQETVLPRQAGLPSGLVCALEEKQFGVWVDFEYQNQKTVEEFLARGLIYGSLILMMPEPRLADWLPFLKERFGNVVIEYHNRLTPATQRRLWYLIKQARNRLLVGVRSVVWAPVEDLRGVVILNEHYSGFKEERKPRFNARDVAITRARLNSCPVVLSDATPAMETWYNVKRGRFQVVTPPWSRPMREGVFVVDMRLHKGEVLSPRLVTELKRAKERNRTALCYINRKGVSRYVVCQTCGTVLRCPDCDVPGVLMSDGTLSCRYCGLTKPAPDSCPNCRGVDFQYRAPGVDMVKRKLEEYGLWDDGKRVVVGTKSVLFAPFPDDLGVVGIINFDTEYALPDFRGREKAFGLLMDVLCRARNCGAKVIIQTYRPDDGVINCALTADVTGFYDWELRMRKDTGFPPHRRLVLFTFSGRKRDRVMEVIDVVRRILSRVDNVEIMGPLLLRKRKPTAHLIMRLPTNIMPGRFLMLLLAKGGWERKGDVTVKVDIDPKDII